MENIFDFFVKLWHFLCCLAAFQINYLAKTVECDTLLPKSFFQNKFPCILHFHTNLHINPDLNRLENKIMSKMLGNLNTVNVQTNLFNISGTKISTKLESFHVSLKVFISVHHQESCLGHIIFPRIRNKELLYFPDWNISDILTPEDSLLFNTITPTYFFAFATFEIKQIQFSNLPGIFETVRVVLMKVSMHSLRIKTIRLGWHTFSAKIKALKALGEIAGWYVSIEYLPMSIPAVLISKLDIDKQFSRFHP